MKKKWMIISGIIMVVLLASAIPSHSQDFNVSISDSGLEWVKFEFLPDTLPYNTSGGVQSCDDCDTRFVNELGDTMSGNLDVSANVSANYFIGNGSQLTSINGSAIEDYTLDDAYDAGSVVTVDDTDVVWNLTNANMMFKTFNNEQNIQFSDPSFDYTLLEIDPYNEEIIFNQSYNYFYDSYLTLYEGGDQMWSLLASGMEIENPPTNPFDLDITKTGIFNIVIGNPTAGQATNFTIKKHVFEAIGGAQILPIFRISAEDLGAGEPGSLQVLESAGWVPLADNVHDLGMSTKRWADLYLAGTIKGTGSGESIFMNASSGDVRFGFQNFNVTNNGTLDLTGNIQHSQNITNPVNTSWGIYNNGSCIVIGDLSYVSEC